MIIPLIAKTYYLTIHFSNPPSPSRIYYNFFNRAGGGIRNIKAKQRRWKNYSIFLLTKLSIEQVKNDLLVPLGWTHYCAYTYGLSTWSSLTDLWYLILRWASHLDAFSGYPFRT